MKLADLRDHATLASRSGGFALGAFVVLALTSCTSDTPEIDAPAKTTPPVEQTAPADTPSDANDPAGLTADAIVAAIEPDGFVCEEQDPLVSDREQVIECRADDYVFITATRLTSADLVKPQLEQAKTAICASELGDGMRAAVSDSWILVPGGDREKDIAAFDKAMKTLDIAWEADLC